MFNKTIHNPIKSFCNRMFIFLLKIQPFNASFILDSLREIHKLKLKITQRKYIDVGKRVSAPLVEK